MRLIIRADLQRCVRLRILPAAQVSLLERISWDVFRVGFCWNLPGLMPLSESGPRNRTGGVAEMLFSRSDNARSCLMICAFSDFSALLRSPTHAFASIANPARAVTTPMNRMLIICAVFLACVVKPVAQDRNCALAGVAGHRLPRLLS